MLGSTQERNLENEPGLNLANLVVAERNSKTAVAASLDAVTAVQALEKRVEALEKQIINLQQQLIQQQQRTFGLQTLGSGPTSAG